MPPNNNPDIVTMSSNKVLIVATILIFILQAIGTFAGIYITIFSDHKLLAKDVAYILVWKKEHDTSHKERKRIIEEIKDWKIGAFTGFEKDTNHSLDKLKEKLGELLELERKMGNMDQELNEYMNVNNQRMLEISSSRCVR